MAISDKLHLLTPTAQQFAATAVCTDTFPLPATGANFGDGEPMCVEFVVTVAGAKAGTEAYTFQVVSATNANGTTGQAILAQSGVYTAAAGVFDKKQQLAVGDRIVVAIPPETIPATATHLTGKVVIASSGDVTCVASIKPLAATRNVQAYTATTTV